MDNNFKWNMFITSFIPLWLTIMVSNIWQIIENVVNNWRYDYTIWINLLELVKRNLISFIVFILIGVLMIVSIISINRFIKDRNNDSHAPKIKIKKATRANKLSSEFLLAYILPMIAFDFSEIRSVVLFIIYFGMLAFLCIRNSNVYTNIWLEIKGYKMYHCDLETIKMGRKHIYEDCLVISKNNLTLEIDNEIEYWDFDNYIYIELT